MSVSFGWIAGYIALPACAWLLHDYQYLQAIPTSIALIFMCTWLLTIPESPRWQLTNNQIEKARLTVAKAAKMNGRITNPDYMSDKFNQLKLNTEMVFKIYFFKPVTL